jgi:purine-binding chemotaxis protein CheW
MSSMSSEQQTWVTFRLHQQVYALPIEVIAQIIQMVAITPIPRLHHVVEGVINVRSAAVPVINLRRHFGLPEASRQLHTPILLVRIGAQIIGLIADEVLDVIHFRDRDVIRLKEILPESLSDAPNLYGMIYNQGQMVLLMEIGNLFLPEKVQAMADAVKSLPDLISAIPDVQAVHENPIPVDAPPTFTEAQTEAQVKPEPVRKLARKRRRSDEKREAALSEADPAAETPPAA